MADVRSTLGLGLLAAIVSLASCSSGQGSESASGPQPTVARKAQPLSATEIGKFVAGDGAANNLFGVSVQRQGGTVLVGASSNGTGPGAAYVFTGSGATWTEQAKLLPSPVTAGDLFGVSVALGTGIAVVGASGDSTGGNAVGAAYVFAQSGTTWTQEAKIAPTGAAAFASFGIDLGLSGTTLAVGAPFDAGTGKVFVYLQSGTAWNEQQVLTAADGEANDLLGASLSLDGDSLLVSAIFDDDKGTDAGAAYVFTRTGTTWTQQAKLTASDGAADDNFGTAVRLTGNLAFVGAPHADTTAVDAGATYVFERTGTTWAETAKLVPANLVEDADFGSSIGFTGNTVLIGAEGTNVVQGAVYGFGLMGTTWTEVLSLEASDGFAGDRFGASMTSTGVLIGAPEDNDKGVNSGSVYVIDLVGSGCSAPGDCFSGSCVNSVCCETTCDAPCDTCIASLGAPSDGTCGTALAGTSGDPSCGPYLCDGTSTACPTTCSLDTDCADGNYCKDNACVPLEEPGEPCADATDCASAFCVDGVCCDTECTGGCQACTAAAKGSGADGECGPIAAGTDPGDECTADPNYPDSCGADGFCDGAGACTTQAAVGTSCGEATCEGNSAVAQACDANGACTAGTPTDCAPYACVAGACKTTCATNADCTADKVCDSKTNTCGDKKPTTPAEEDDDGCGCRIVGSSSQGGALAALFSLLGLALWRRRLPRRNGRGAGI